jgi:hypothetical protein
MMTLATSAFALFSPKRAMMPAAEPPVELISPLLTQSVMVLMLL